MPVLKNIGQLATCPPGNPQHDAGLIERAALAWSGETVRWVGPQEELPEAYRSEPVIDAERRLVIPGLIDCHTHLCFGGWRGDEWADRLRGKTYQQVAAEGGGIVRTVTATRAASAGELERKARFALDEMLRLGVTTVECKSGYGLDEGTELKQLEVYRRLDADHPVDLVPTFLGAHVPPPEFRDDPDAYIESLCESLLPQVVRSGLARFCDVFVERGAFSSDQARRLLEAAAALGMGLKVHADQLADGGGAALAAELGAVSAEHLEYASAAGIAALASAGTVAVSLPLASLFLRERYLAAREMIAAGVRVAVATDFNPGSAPSYHLPLAMSLACLNQGMTPAEALMGATTIAARAVSLEQDRGALLPGFRADLAIVDAPNVDHWLYHFRANACLRVLRSGSWA